MFGKRKDRGHGDARQAPLGEHLKPYVDAVEALGATFEATLWASEDHQRVRFEVLLRMCPMQGRSVLDAGCARGDLGVFLAEHAAAASPYIGIDGVPELIDAGRAHAPKGSHLEVADFVSDPSSMRRAAAAAGQPEGKVDVAVFSGSLNTLTTDAALDVLEHAWPLCREALAFNFLSDRCDPDRKRGNTGPAKRFDTLRVLGWALERTPAVRFRQDYFPGGHDATIVMRRERS